MTAVDAIGTVGGLRRQFARALVRLGVLLVEGVVRLGACESTAPACGELAVVWPRAQAWLQHDRLVADVERYLAASATGR